MEFKSKLKVGLVFGAVVMISACNGNSSSGSPVAAEGGSVAPQQARVYFDSVGQIPTQAQGNAFSVRIHNSFAKQFSLKSLSILDPKTGVADSSLASATGTMCSTVPARNNCSISITPHLTGSGSFILQAELLDSEGKLHILKQLLRVSDKINGTNGIVFDNDLNNLASVDGNYHMSFPVVLDAKFDELKASNGTVLCSIGYNPGSN